jgi:hypothetical protein
MAKLSDTQFVILSTACQRDDRLVLPLPDRLTCTLISALKTLPWLGTRRCSSS